MTSCENSGQYLVWDQSGSRHASHPLRVISPEHFVTLFVFAGVLKAIPAVSRVVPWDLTILLGAAAVMSLVLRALTRGHFTRLRVETPDLWAGGLAAALMLGCLYTPAPWPQALFKVAEFAGLGLLASYVLPRLIAAFDEPIKVVRRCLLVLVAVAGLLSLVVFVQAPGLAFARSPEGSYLSWGYLLGAALIAACGMIARSRTAVQRVVLLLVLPIIGGALVFARGRGPLLALAGVLAVWGLAAYWIRMRRRVAVSLVAVIGLVILLAALPSDLRYRYSRLMTDDLGGSVEARLDAYATAWPMFLRSPLLGAGTGSYGTVHDRFDYPHNIMLETLAEQGLIGAIVLLGLVVAVLARLRKALRHARGPDRAVIASAGGVFLLMLFGSMVSGDITSRTLWFAAGLAVTCSRAITTGTADHMNEDALIDLRAIMREHDE